MVDRQRRRQKKRDRQTGKRQTHIESRLREMKLGKTDREEDRVTGILGGRKKR